MTESTVGVKAMKDVHYAPVHLMYMHEIQMHVQYN